MNQESGGNPNSINNWDTNAKAGDPSRGLMQTIGSTFNAYKNPAWSSNIYDPLNNIYAGLNYALHRYGSLSALNRPGGYDEGGYLTPGLSLTYNGTRRPEPVLSGAQWDAITANTSGGDGAMEITGELTVNGLDAHIDGRVRKANDATGTRIVRGVR
jgi:SLT domain-containing protein